MESGTSPRLVHCKKFNQQLPGLSHPPFKGELGQLIFENVSEQAWRLWKEDMQIKVINEYRLNLGDKQDYEVLIQQMKRFLGLEEGTVNPVNDR